MQVSITGTLNPGMGGTDFGTLTLDSTNATKSILAIEGAGTLRIDISTAGNDLLSVTDAVASDVRFINSGSTLAFNDLSGNLLAGTYLIVSTDSLNNTVFNLAGTQLVGSGPQTIWDTGAGTDLITVTGLGFYSDASVFASAGDLYLTVVPEPSAFAMLVGGFGVLLGFQRRRRIA